MFNDICDIQIVSHLFNNHKKNNKKYDNNNNNENKTNDTK